MGLIVSNVTELPLNGRFILEIDAIFDPEGIAISIDQVLVPRAGIAGQSVLLVRAEALDGAGAPAFPLDNITAPIQLKLRFHLPRSASPADWLLIHFILDRGNRLAFRLTLARSGANLSATVEALEGARKSFLFGLVATCAALIAIRNFGDRLLPAFLAGSVDLGSLVPLLLAALLGAVAVPSLFSFAEMFTLIRRPEARVTPPLFMTLSNRWWGWAALLVTVVVAGLGAFLGSFKAPLTGASELAWFDSESREKVAEGARFSRLGLSRLRLAPAALTKLSDQTRSGDPLLGTLEVSLWRPLVLSAHAVEQALRPSKWVVQFDDRTRLQLRGQLDCDEATLAAFAGQNKTFVEIFRVACFAPLRPTLLSALGGPDAPATPGLRVSASRDTLQIASDQPEPLTIADLKQAIAGFFVLPIYNTPTPADIANLDAMVPALPVAAALGERTVRSQACVAALPELTGRWDAELNVGARRNAVRVQMARRLFEHCESHLSSEDPLAVLHREFVKGLQERLFYNGTGGPYPAASEAAMMAFYSWLCATARERPDLRSAVFNVSASTGDHSHAWLLRAVTAEPPLVEDPVFKQQLLERYYRYAAKPAVLTEIGRIQQGATNEAVARFLAGILAGPASVPSPVAAAGASPEQGAPASSASP